MRTDDERAARSPDYPRPPVAPLQPCAARLRRHGFGPVAARYLAALPTLEDVSETLPAVGQVTPEDWADGVVEPEALEAVRVAADKVWDALVRQLEIEARHAVIGLCRPGGVPVRKPAD